MSKRKKIKCVALIIALVMVVDVAHGVKIYPWDTDQELAFEKISKN